MKLRAPDVAALATTLEELVLWLRHATPSELSSSTITALGRLDREGPLRVSELARRERMTQPGVTILVNRLAQAGLAERVPDPTDGRAALVRITAEGEALIAERHEARISALRTRLAQLDDDDRARILAALPALDRLIDTPPRSSDSTPRPTDTAPRPTDSTSREADPA